MSRMPTMDMWRVRGMGVAESVSTSIWVFMCLMISLCWTPKRCSSSTISRPRSLNFTSLARMRCVPIRMSIFPAAARWRMSFCSLGVRKRESTSQVTGNPAKRRCTVL